MTTYKSKDLGYLLSWARTSRSIGCINNRRRNRTILIVHDDATMAKINMRLIASRMDGSGPGIVVSSLALELPRFLLEAGIWHEVGHFHHNHFTSGRYKNQQELREARIGCVAKGEVMPEEREADLFAVHQVGKRAVVGFLSLVAMTRPEGAAGELNEIGLRELQLRIDAINRL